MDYTLILENDWGAVYYASEHQYIFCPIKQPVQGQPLYDLLNAGADHLAQAGYKKWLSDIRKHGESSAEDITYGLTIWGPRAAQAGWKYWALVVPESVAGRAGMVALVEGYFNLGVRVVVFTDVELAHEWLIRQT
jgi:hypothetical protein